MMYSKSSKITFSLLTTTENEGVFFNYSYPAIFLYYFFIPAAIDRVIIKRHTWRRKKYIASVNFVKNTKLVQIYRLISQQFQPLSFNYGHV